MADLETFRAETRAWLEANCPPEMREPVRDEDDIYWGGRRATFKNDAQKAWLEACIAKGYTVPMWPKEYGGMGLGAAKQVIYYEEMSRYGCARIPDHGLVMGLLMGSQGRSAQAGNGPLGGLACAQAVAVRLSDSAPAKGYTST